MIGLLWALAATTGSYFSHVDADLRSEETWECRYENVPPEFPKSIEFFMGKDGRGGTEILERGHLPYRVLEDNLNAIVAVSSIADSGGRFVGPAGHTIQQQFIGNDVRWKNVLVSAETLEISRSNGASVIAVVRLDGSPVLAVRGTCRRL